MVANRTTAYTSNQFIHIIIIIELIMSIHLFVRVHVYKTIIIGCSSSCDKVVVSKAVAMFCHI